MYSHKAVHILAFLAAIFSRNRTTAAPWQRCPEGPPPVVIFSAMDDEPTIHHKHHCEAHGTIGGRATSFPKPIKWVMMREVGSCLITFKYQLNRGDYQVLHYEDELNGKFMDSSLKDSRTGLKTGFKSVFYCPPGWAQLRDERHTCQKCHSSS